MVFSKILSNRLLFIPMYAKMIQFDYRLFVNLVAQITKFRCFLWGFGGIFDYLARSRIVIFCWPSIIRGRKKKRIKRSTFATRRSTQRSTVASPRTIWLGMIGPVFLTRWGGPPKIGFFYPQIIHFNRIFHEINHPFWVFSPYSWNHPGGQDFPLLWQGTNGMGSVHQPKGCLKEIRHGAVKVE